MAWAVVVLYYVFAVKLVEALYSHQLSSTYQKHIATVVLVVVTLLAVLVMREQHRLRRVAADVYAACQRFASKSLTMTDEEIESLDLGLAQPPQATAPYQAPAYLANCLVAESQSLSGTGQRSRQQLERLSYWLVGVALVVAFGAIWLA